MKILPVIFIFFTCVIPVFSQDFSVILEINNIEAGKGTVHVGVFNSADGYKKQASFIRQTAEPAAASVKLDLLLPAGEYVVSVYQDSNMNGKLDANFVGMPKEPVGISNYSGKGIPGGFDKLKAVIGKSGTVLTVNMARL